MSNHDDRNLAETTSYQYDQILSRFRVYNRYTPVTGIQVWSMDTLAWQTHAMFQFLYPIILYLIK